MIYQGGWEKGLMHGTGTLYDADGAVYTGSFATGNRHGHGVQQASTRCIT